MASDRVRVICGPGYGKSASALGYAMMGVFRGKRVIDGTVLERYDWEKERQTS